MTTAEALAVVREDTEEWERIAQEHGVVFLLDHLGLDGFGNEVRDLRACAQAAEQRVAELEAALRAYEDDSLTEDEFRAIARRALGGGE